jgi:hypothetical protein
MRNTSWTVHVEIVSLFVRIIRENIAALVSDSHIIVDCGDPFRNLPYCLILSLVVVTNSSYRYFSTFLITFCVRR